MIISHLPVKKWLWYTCDMSWWKLLHSIVYVIETFSFRRQDLIQLHDEWLRNIRNHKGKWNSPNPKETPRRNSNSFPREYTFSVIYKTIAPVLVTKLINGHIICSIVSPSHLRLTGNELWGCFPMLKIIWELVLWEDVNYHVLGSLSDGISSKDSLEELGSGEYSMYARLRNARWSKVSLYLWQIMWSREVDSNRNWKQPCHHSRGREASRVPGNHHW